MRLLLCILLCVCVFSPAQVICIDAGHGGSDPGATGWGIKESEIVLDVIKRLETLLRNAGYKPILTRSSEVYVSLSSRTNYANSYKAQRFVSVHCNAFNQSAHGTETFCYSSGSSTSFKMRDYVNPKLVAALGTYNRGCKTAGFYVIKHTNMPAILCELAFIDNQADSKKLAQSYYRQACAQAIFNGIHATFGRDEEVLRSNDDYVAPKWSTDGRSLLFAQAGNHNLMIASVDGKEVKSIAKGKNIAQEAKWISASEIHCPGKFTIRKDGVKVRTFEEKVYPIVVEKDNEIWVNNGLDTKAITPRDGIFFNAHVSPDKTKIVFESLRKGMFVCNIDGTNLISLGHGNNPSWSPDSKKIVFDKTTDNGHEITSGDIWMIDISARSNAVNLTKGTGILAQRPMISPDAKYIAFDAKGSIYIAENAGSYLKKLRKITK